MMIHGGATVAAPNKTLARFNKSRMAVLAANWQSSQPPPNGDGCPAQSDDTLSGQGKPLILPGAQGPLRVGAPASFNVDRTIR
jgi:hypothetical protein